MSNLWLFLLNGLLGFITVVIFPIFGVTDTGHTALGLGQIIGQNAYVILEVFYTTFGQYNMDFAFTCVMLMFAIWLVKLGVKIYLFIKSLIPLIG